MVESTTSGLRTVPGIGDYVDNTSANGHANVYGLATCTNQMLAEDYNRRLTSALDQVLAQQRRCKLVTSKLFATIQCEVL